MKEKSRSVSIIYFLIIFVALISCGKKDDQKNVVTTTPPPKFPQNQTYDNCNNQQGYYSSLANLCQDLQINYSGTTGRTNYYCNENERRRVHRRYCPSNRFSWNPSIVMRNIYNAQNQQVICDLSNPQRVNSKVSGLVHRSQTTLVHPNFVAVIIKQNIGYNTNLEINIFNNSHNFVGSTQYNFSQGQQLLQDITSPRSFGNNIQIRCRPIEMQQRNSRRSSSSSSSSFYYSWSFSSIW